MRCDARRRDALCTRGTAERRNGGTARGYTDIRPVLQTASAHLPGFIRRLKTLFLIKFSSRARARARAPPPRGAAKFRGARSSPAPPCRCSISRRRADLRVVCAGFPSPAIRSLANGRIVGHRGRPASLCQFHERIPRDATH